MRLSILSVAFLCTFLVAGSAFSDCVWKCKEQVEAHIDQPIIPGQPPQLLACLHPAQPIGRMLYTDNGDSNIPVELDGNLNATFYPISECTEACWTPNGPVLMQEATFNTGTPIPPLFTFQISSFRCVVSGTE